MKMYKKKRNTKRNKIIFDDEDIVSCNFVSLIFGGVKFPRSPSNNCYSKDARLLAAVDT